MICAKCDQAIKPGEAYTKVEMPGASRAPATVHLHEICPPKPRRS
ncbi:hypothetical protein [Streptomyces sp. NPDC058066]